MEFTEKQSFRDRMSQLVQISRASGLPAMRYGAAIKRVNYLSTTSTLAARIKEIEERLAELRTASSKATLFNADEGKISELMIYVKESIAEVQSTLARTAKEDHELQYSRQADHSAKVITEILQLRLSEVTKKFRQTLQLHSENLKRNEERKTRLGVNGKTRGEAPKPAKGGPRFLSRGMEANRNGDLEGNGGGALEVQEYDERKHLTRRADAMKNLERMMGEVATIFHRLGTIVQMHEVMIDRIDKTTEDTLVNIEKGKKHLIQIHEDISSYRGLIIKVPLLSLQA
eukprot:TRINITY_DN764_c0_g1_i9.p1 TRINITY_DN764_c0_g1~~TRINITY_DN764_c0_g1_i9.p1  ORF type:complete len:287 (+),score=44.97 TRINITY_DN764_c0_g1_i9:164-1024(+)